MHSRITSLGFRVYKVGTGFHQVHVCLRFEVSGVNSKVYSLKVHVVSVALETIYFLNISCTLNFLMSTFLQFLCPGCGYRVILSFRVPVLEFNGLKQLDCDFLMFRKSR